MSDTLSRTLRILLAILLFVSVAITFWFGYVASDVSGDLDADTQISQFGPVLEYFISWAYVLFFVAAGSAIVFAIWQIVSNPKGAVKTLVSIAIFAAVLLISWSLASDEMLHMPTFDGELTPGTMKFAGASLWGMYILAATAVLAIAYSEISKIFK